MFSVTTDFLNAQAQGLAPKVLVYLITILGVRVYATTPPLDAELGNVGNISLHDGSFVYDGSRRYGEGTQSILETGGLLLSEGVLQETLAPQSENLLLSLRGNEAGSVIISLNNADKHFSYLVQEDVLLGAQVLIKVAYRGLSGDSFLTRFRGQVETLRLRRENVELEVVAS